MDKRKRNGDGGGGDYSRKAIILKISVKGRGGDYSKEAINRGTAIIRGNTVYESRYNLRGAANLAVFYNLQETIDTSLRSSSG